jgi:hypothetical protein
VALLLSGLALGCSARSPLKTDGGAAGASGAGGDRGAAGASAGTTGESGHGGVSGGAGGAVVLGSCETSADCETRSECCESSCAARTDPVPPRVFCESSQCPVGDQSAGSLACGCVNHQCALSAEEDGGAGGAGGASGAGDAGGATTLPACTWPAELGNPDAGKGACRPARALLDCTSGNIGEECLSDNANHCNGDNPIPGATFTCHDTCSPQEYAVACGSIGGQFGGEPPAGCHDPSATPGGIVFFCCPCL